MHSHSNAPLLHETVDRSEPECFTERGEKVSEVQLRVKGPYIQISWVINNVWALRLVKKKKIRPMSSSAENEIYNLL